MSDFERLSFSAPQEAAQRFAAAALRYLGRESPARILDLGCGNGQHALALAQACPNMSVFGIDISPANIDVARGEAQRRGLSDRASFSALDYMDFRPEPFDAIISDTVLHLIPGTTAALAERLASDLKPAGLFIMVMPFDLSWNRVLVAARKLLSSVRGRWLDAAILSLAKAFYRSWPEALLRERIPYMYTLPERFDEELVHELTARHGFVKVATEPWPSTSFAKLRHRLTVLRREEAGAS